MLALLLTLVVHMVCTDERCTTPIGGRYVCTSLCTRPDGTHVTCTRNCVVNPSTGSADCTTSCH